MRVLRRVSGDEAALAVSIGATHGDIYLSAGEKMTLYAFVEAEHEEPIFIDATCYRNGEEWTVVLAPELKFGSDAWDDDDATLMTAAWGRSNHQCLGARADAVAEASRQSPVLGKVSRISPD